MSKTRKLLFVLLITLPSLNVQAEQRGNYWVVQSGDTLYAISRALFPASSLKQYKLRTQIIRLNPEVFQKGAGNLYLGAKLLLPSSVKYRTNEIEESPAKALVVVPEPKKTAIKKVLEKNEWLIKSGDSLYSIARFFYPNSTRQQYKLRNDIMQLNSDIFRAGANKMKVGLILLMPDYLVKKDSVIVKLPLIKPKPVPIVTTTVVKVEPVRKKISNDLELESEIESEKNKQTDDRVTNYQNNDYSSQFSTAIGYSAGGDTVITVQGRNDVTLGSGFNLRLSYDGLWERKQGYRLSLGYQFDKVSAENNNDTGQAEQIYLQSLYLYNLSNSLIGLGVSYHDYLSKTTDFSTVNTVTDYEPAIGWVMMYEYIRFYGNNIVGVSYTKAETEELVSKEALDISRTEIYYRWAF